MNQEPSIPTIGAHQGIGFAEYLGWKALNWHTLEPVRLSALEGRHRMLNPADATADMVLGGAFHTALLEPAKFDAIYKVMPEFTGHPNSNAAKAEKKAWQEANAAAVHLTSDEQDRLIGMQKSVLAHPVAAALVSSTQCYRELTIIWTDPLSGELCKGRIDLIARIPASVLEKGTAGVVDCLVEFKKTSFIHRFDREASKYGYHGQLAYYADGAVAAGIRRSLLPLIVAVQDKPPFDVAVFNAGDAVEHGRRLYRRLMQTFVLSKKANSWPGIAPVGTIPLILPKWDQEPEEA